MMPLFFRDDGRKGHPTSSSSSATFDGGGDTPSSTVGLGGFAPTGRGVGCHPSPVWWYGTSLVDIARTTGNNPRFSSGDWERRPYWQDNPSGKAPSLLSYYEANRRCPAGTRVR